MFTRAILAFLVLPGLAAFIVPPILALIDPWRGGVFYPGTLIMLIGIILLFWCVWDFYTAGKGTLAPWDPPKSLVVVGLYRFMRNPMYVGVLALVAGWAAFFTSPVLLIYALSLAIGFHIRVVTYEEPHLKTLFGSEWERYCSAVPRWLPRLKPLESGF